MEDLKILAGCLIIESCYSNADKQFLLDLIYESSIEEEIKSLILNDVPMELEEDAKEIVNKRFDIMIENLLLTMEDDKLPKPESKAGKALKYGRYGIYGVYLPKSVLSKGKEFATSPTGQAIGGVATAALIAYAAYKIYSNYFSKAATACKGATDKGVCMKQYKNKAIKAQISKLSSGASLCSKSKDPEKCRSAIQNKINKLKYKVK